MSRAGLNWALRTLDDALDVAQGKKAMQRRSWSSRQKFLWIGCSVKKF